LLGQIIMFPRPISRKPFTDPQFHILTLHAGELLSDMEGLGKETLDLSPRARD